MDHAQKEEYLREYEVLKKKGKPFFPYAVLKDSAMFLIVVVVIMVMSIVLGAEQGPKADPTTTNWEESKNLLAQGKIGSMVLGSWAVSQMQDAAEAAGASRDDIQAKIDDLNTKSQEMGAAMYAAAAEQGESADVPGAEAGDGSAPADGSSDDDVVDAEVVDEDDEEKK